MKAITYARVSPRPAETDSLEIQSRELAEYCESMGWEHRLHNYDDQRSGSELRRPGLAAALSGLRKGWVLVVRDLSRFARDVNVALALESELREKGCFLATMESGIVLDPTEDDLAYLDAVLPRFVKYWADARERIVKNRRTSARMLEHQASGRPMGKDAPYGMRIEDCENCEGSGGQCRALIPPGFEPEICPICKGKGKVLVEDDYEQVVIIGAKQLGQMGLGYREIARELGSKYTSRSGNGFTHQLVKRMIHEL